MRWQVYSALVVIALAATLLGAFARDDCWRAYKWVTFDDGYQAAPAFPRIYQ